MKQQAEKTSELPRHVAIVMDGNGRWACRHGRARRSGHRAGVKAARGIVEAAMQVGVECLTLFAFSSENWQRPPDEVNSLMRLFVEVLQREIDALHENNVQLRFIGDREHLPTILRKRMADAETLTAGNHGMTLVLAIAFGGRWDLVSAARRIAEKVQEGQIEPDAIDESLFQRHLSLSGLPDPDLLIRTGGERRVSNFLLWDIAYTEIYFTETLWPDFSADELQAALEFYAQRSRRFGRTAEQLEMIAD